MVSRIPGASRRFVRNQIEMCDAPGARRQQVLVHFERGAAIGVATCGPDGEDEREPGPLLPCRAQILEHRVDTARAKVKCRVANDEHGVVRKGLQAGEIIRLRSRRGKVWRDLPDVLAEELKEQMRRARGCGCATTVAPLSSCTGRLLKSATLCTGPSHEIARCGRR